MTLEERIAQFRALITQRDEIDRQIAELLGDAALQVPTKQRKWHKANKKGRDLQQEIEQHHSARAAVRQHPETARIEEMLIAGSSVR